MCGGGTAFRVAVNRCVDEVQSLIDLHRFLSPARSKSPVSSCAGRSCPLGRLFGTDELVRDMFSGVLYAGRVSLSVGLLGVAISFVLGVVIGGVSGYVGGAVDTVIHRIIEFLISIPTLPLWMG